LNFLKLLIFHQLLFLIYKVFGSQVYFFLVFVYDTESELEQLEEIQGAEFHLLS